MTNEKIITIALEFNSLLRELLGPEKYSEVCRINRRETNPGICASHNYCDANVWMARAFKTVLGLQVKPNNEKHAGIWNRAWDMAKTLQVAPRPRAIIVIDGGNCTGVCSNVDLSVDILDRDNERVTPPAKRKEFEELEAECDQLEAVY